MSDDGKFIMADYAAWQDSDGEITINPMVRLSGVSVSSVQNPLKLDPWAWSQARRVYEEEGRIKPGEPFFRVIGTAHLCPKTEKDIP